MGRVRRWLVTARDEEVASTCRILVLIVVIAYVTLLCPVFDIVERANGAKSLMLLAPILAGALGGLRGWLAARSDDRRSVFALLTALTWSLATTLVAWLTVSVILFVAIASLGPA